MKTQRLVGFIRVCVLVLGTMVADRAGSATFVVTNIGDTGPGSLRQAILSANLAAGVPDVINFNIPGAGPHTISLSPATPLPTVTDPNFLHPGGFATNVPAGYYRVRLGP